MPNVLVIHANGATSITKRARAQGVVANGRAYWRDRARTVLVMIKSTDDTPADGYEYGGTCSLDLQATGEQIDKTLTPVRDAGGHTVLQLRPMIDRRTRGYAATRRDSLWRPARRDRKRPVSSQNDA